jgi:hypothetical protein
LSFLQKKEYEAWKTLPENEVLEGICFAIEIDENISNEEFKKQNVPPYLKVNFYGEARDGNTPARGNFGGELVTV